MRSKQMDYDCPCDARFVSVSRLCVAPAPQSFVPGSLQLRILRFGLLQDGNVGVGVLPEGDERRPLLPQSPYWWSLRTTFIPRGGAARQVFDTQSQCGCHLRRLPVEGVDFLSGYVADEEGSIARSEAGPGAGTKRDGEGTNFFQVHDALKF